MSNTQPKLLDQLRAQICLKHYSYRTEQTYVLWVKQFIRFHGCRHPLEMGKAEIEACRGLRPTGTQRGLLPPPGSSGPPTGGWYSITSSLLGGVCSTTLM